MPENHNSPDPIRDLAREQMLPTTMHGTRPLVTISDTRHGAAGAARDGGRGLMTKLCEKVVNHLRGLAL